MGKVALWVLPARYANLLQCSRKGLWNDYFGYAEGAMETQWKDVIWPLIRDFDFMSVLELAPGAGRNTERLCPLSKRIVAVDFNAYALKQCRKRLGDLFQGCEIVYHRNNGSDLRMVPDGSISTVYSWDAMIHFDRSIVADYIAEFSRVLKPGGNGFIHHSNLGEKADKNIRYNPSWRSNVSREFVAAECGKHGLKVVAQKDVPWETIMDCVTVFAKPVDAVPEQKE